MHMSNGWDFDRMENGDVRIMTADHDLMEIPAIEWVSIITAVSPNAGDGDVFARAKELHGIE